MMRYDKSILITVAPPQPPPTRQSIVVQAPRLSCRLSLPCYQVLIHALQRHSYMPSRKMFNIT
jgi:hypothetical protein